MEHEQPVLLGGEGGPRAKKRGGQSERLEAFTDGPHPENVNYGEAGQETVLKFLREYTPDSVFHD